jgi:ectoine hydroxylase-related dioxygenase (phytanoyl-CoA dioxygenase family)
MFAYLTEVRPGGGGTLIVAGSHRLAGGLDGIKSAAFRTWLSKRSDWFQELWRPVAGDDRVRRHMEDGAEIDGVHVRVVELTGAPGDVVLWHPSLLHIAAPNCSEQPRFMLTHTAYRTAHPAPAS